jgi:GAF domain-containing protein
VADGRGEGKNGEGKNSKGKRRRRRPLRDEEPFATIRAHPRRFGWGIPLVFLGSIGAGLLVADRNLSAAIAIQLFLQTVGLLWLYIPPARRRWQEERRRLEEARGAVGSDEDPGERQG